MKELMSIVEWLLPALIGAGIVWYTNSRSLKIDQQNRFFDLRIDTYWAFSSTALQIMQAFVNRRVPDKDNVSELRELAAKIRLLGNNDIVHAAHDVFQTLTRLAIDVANSDGEEAILDDLLSTDTLNEIGKKMNELESKFRSQIGLA